MQYHEAWVDEPYDVESEYVHVSELEELETKIEYAKDFLSEALEGLYGEKSLDQMERALEEVCAYLDVPFPIQELKVTKTKPHLSNPYFKFGALLSQKQAQVVSRTQHQ